MPADQTECWKPGRRRVKRLLEVSMVLCLMMLVAPHEVVNAQPQGATITVNTENDDNSPDDYLSLRQAIGLANGDVVLCLTTLETKQAPTVNWVPAPPWPSCGGAPSSYPRYNVAPPPADPRVGINAADSIVFTDKVG